MRINELNLRKGSNTSKRDRQREGADECQAKKK